jgi:hypothetical protein
MSLVMKQRIVWATLNIASGRTTTSVFMTDDEYQDSCRRRGVQESSTVFTNTYNNDAKDPSLHLGPAHAVNTSNYNHAVDVRLRLNRESHAA